MGNTNKEEHISFILECGVVRSPVFSLLFQLLMWLLLTQLTVEQENLGIKGILA